MVRDPTTVTFSFHFLSFSFIFFQFFSIFFNFFQFFSIFFNFFQFFSIFFNFFQFFSIFFNFFQFFFNHMFIVSTVQEMTCIFNDMAKTKPKIKLTINKGNNCNQFLQDDQ